eukprot:TRINITY_DN64782_c0_g1_i1.p1 TRINITY_DN64782_c0_g1~~TRINITY_DN64782_c0_g1_i1.p1  ORF type:complete len:230 (+),score=52.20 TRINITY_DN64782_c0_g1_i1:79-690(+)
MRPAALLAAAALVQSSLADTCDWPQDGVVMGGADVVAYFSLLPGAPGVKGSSEHAADFEGYTFWFVSAANRATFLSDPNKYVPAWGGFCAWGIAREGTDSNPSPQAQPGWPWDGKHMGPPCGPTDGWKIIDGRLFCAIDRRYIESFAFLGEQGIADGDMRWSAWYGGQNRGPLNTGCFGPPRCIHKYNDCLEPGKSFPARTRH